MIDRKFDYDSAGSGDSKGHEAPILVREIHKRMRLEIRSDALIDLAKRVALVAIVLLLTGTAISFSYGYSSLAELTRNPLFWVVGIPALVAVIADFLFVYLVYFIFGWNVSRSKYFE